MKKNKKRKLDIIIYVSLIAAFVCVIASGIDYAHSIKNKNNSLKEEVKQAIEEITPTKEPDPEPVDVDPNAEVEIPSYFNEVELNSEIRKYIDEIYDYYKKDNVIKYSIIKSWGSYDVYDTVFLRKVTDEYYSFQFKIKMNGENPTLPVDKDPDLSTPDYTVIVLNANFAREKNSTNYYLKTLEIPQ